MDRKLVGARAAIPEKFSMCECSHAQELYLRVWICILRIDFIDVVTLRSVYYKRILASDFI